MTEIFDPISVKRRIGGELTEAWLGANTCVMRVCRSLNYAGKEFQIKAGNQMAVVKGADKLLYGYRVAEFKKYLNKIYGTAFITRKSDKNISDEDFRGTKGIIGFDVLGWSDATGHFSLWDGSKVLFEGSHHYFSLPQKPSFPNTAYLQQVSLWKCSG